MKVAALPFVHTPTGDRHLRIRYSRSGRKGAYCACGWVGNPRRLTRAAAVIDFAGHKCLEAPAMTRYDDVTHAQGLEQLERDYRAGRIRPYPARMTQALDLGGHYGPQVDVACSAREPAVDQWEAGVAVPSWEQLCALAALTAVPVEFFFRAPEPGVTTGWICGRGRGGCSPILPKPPVPRFGERRPEPVTSIVKDTLW